MRTRPLLARTLGLAVPLYLVTLGASLIGALLATAGLAAVAGSRPWLPDLLGVGWVNTLLELVGTLVTAAPDDRRALALLGLGAFLGVPLLLVLQWLGYTFVAGGILERLLFARAGAHVSPPFGQSCRRWFWPFVRLGLMGLIVVGALATVGAAATYYLADVLGSTLAFLLLSAWTAILLGWLEVGRAAMVWHGYRAAGPALRRAVSLVARPQSILLWLFLALPGIALLVGVSSLPPVSDAISLSTILTTLLLGQVYGFLGAWLKVIRLAAACGIVASRTRSPLTPRG